MKYHIPAILPGLVLALVLGCGGSAPPPTAKATLINSQGQKVGEAKLSETPQGVKIDLKVENLLPGVHAFHIHEKGVCNPADFSSAGGHFNPFGKQHGFQNPLGHHAGDLPNITVGSDGRVSIQVTAPLVTLKPGKNSLFQPGGTSLVIHEKADDNVTDPAGNAGARIACGVITP